MRKDACSQEWSGESFIQMKLGVCMSAGITAGRRINRPFARARGCIQSSVESPASAVRMLESK